MKASPSDISVVIPSYRRGKVLLDTLRHLLELPVKPGEILVVDQTEEPLPEVLEFFQTLEKKVPDIGKTAVRRIQLPEPSIPHAMNVGLREAKGEIVLFLDDDIIPDEQLIFNHWKTYEEAPEAFAVVGQVLQPEENFQTTPFVPRLSKSILLRDIDFKFNSTEPVWIENVMAGNLSVKRARALAVGGFDENFIPPVSFRFETELARRLIDAGGKIRFAPEASVQHLRLSTGGTRSRGSHLTSASPVHGAGDYYYALRCGKGLERILYMLRRPFREVCTKFHLLHPWWIPVKFIGELRAMAVAVRLYRLGCRRLENEALPRPCKLCVVETHPIQYKAPLFRTLARDPRFDLTVLYAMIPDSSQQGAGFGVAFSWDVPLLDGYHYEVLENCARNPSASQFSGCDTPGIYSWLKAHRPDAVLINGWVAKTCLQSLLACRRLRIPSIVRGEINLLWPRAWWKHVLHDLLLSQYNAFLSVGVTCDEFFRFHRRPAGRVFRAPCAIDNDFFSAQASQRKAVREALRSEFGIPAGTRVFLFVGKLEAKKNPQHLLQAFAGLSPEEQSRSHVLIAGNGPLLEVCKRFAAEHHLPVTFAGFVNQSRLPDVYAAADVLVLPSDAGETWGLVVNEAMASGRPAIVSRSVGCCRDLVVEGETGFSFEVEDVGALTGLLRRYLAEPGLAAKQGVKAAEHIQQFSFTQFVEGLAQAVSFCAEKKGGIAC